ncbi:MAG: hypothetical protein IPK26_20100 [Planctomycetes bacterium]|nr:hypothetical protein [Planctomycetota bacterium]
MQRNLIVQAAVIGLFACLAHGQDRKQVDTGTVSFDAQKGALSVKVDGLTVSDVLARLQTQHGIRVTVVDLQDRKVSLDIQDKPLADALTALLGKDVRYQLDFAKDVELPAPAGGVQQPKPGVVPASTLPEMPARATPRPGMPQMGEVAPVAGATMRPAAQIQGEVIEGELPEAGNQGEVADAGTHAVLLLRLQKGQAPVVLRVIEQQGTLVVPTKLQGDWLWDLTVGGRAVAVGSLQDPHAAFPICEERPRDPRLKTTRKEEAEVIVSIAVGKELLDPAVRGQAVLRMSKLTDAAGLPAEFGLDTFAAFAGKSKEVATVGAEALLQARTDRK